MVVNKSIPAATKIGNFLVAFCYQGQPPTCFVCQDVGHGGKDCLKSRKRKAAAVNESTQSKCSVSDLREKISPKKPIQDPNAFCILFF